MSAYVEIPPELAMDERPFCPEPLEEYAGCWYIVVRSEPVPPGARSCRNCGCPQ